MSERRANANTGGPRSSGASEPVDPGDESPQVPGFRTWRGVYWFVFIVFVVVVVALAVFSRAYR